MGCMAFRAKNPVTIRCEWCGVTKTLKGSRPKRDGAFCGRKCSTAWHRQKDAETVWRLMELTRLLWKSRPEGFKFEPAEFPGLRDWRVELNATGKWVRELS
jgi:hypothetical protein